MSIASVTITESEYRQLKWAQRKLEALEDAGVDNWEGYGDALSTLNDNLPGHSVGK